MEISKKAIIGIEGLELNNDEIDILKKYSPVGYILFSRNIHDKDQVKNLVGNIRNIIGWNCPVLIDQEGGSVQRLTKPGWPKYPPSNLFGKLAKSSLKLAKRATYLNYVLLGLDLKELGINVNCAPCLDVKSINMHSVIGDRAFSSIPDIVSSLGESACNGLIDSGVLPIIKHIPGHGKSITDSHKELPIISDKIDTLERSDFIPFKDLSNMPIAMTAHILYTEIDNKFSITQSKKAYNYIRNNIRYDGILISDDIEMAALKGTIEDRVRSIIKAGYDIILHCSGNLNAAEKVLLNAPLLGSALSDKLKLSLNMIKNPEISLNKTVYLNEINKIFNNFPKLELEYYK
jgi:beta-N-acetylhexosaminidase